MADAEGNANYNIYRGGNDTVRTSDSSAGAGIKLEGIFIRNSEMLYRDQSVPMTIQGDSLNYSGKGNLQDDDFDLQSNINIGSFSFEYDGTPYVQRKPLNAELVTNINTSSLVIRFTKNDLMLKKLPVDFTGNLAIVKDGYDIDLKIISGVTDFANIFSVLPPEYDGWVANMQFTGSSRATMAMQGSYRAATGQQPNLSATLRVQNGSFKHNSAPVPLQNLHFNAAFDMPALDMEQIALRVDSLGFDINGEPTNATLLYKGYTKPYIKANVQTHLNFDLLNQAMALPDYFSIKGKLAADVNMDGPLDYTGNKLPKTKAIIDWQNGSIKTPYYPKAIEQILLKANVNCPGGTPADVSILLAPASFMFEEMPFAATAQVKNLNSPVYDITAKGNINLTNIYKVFAVKNVNLTGTIVADVVLKGAVADAEKGAYDRLDNRGTIGFNNLKFQTALYQHPFELPEGTIRLHKDKAYIKHLQLNYAQNRFILNGTAAGFIAYYMGKGNFSANLQVQSPRLLVDDFIAYQAPATDSTTVSTPANGVVMLPEKMALRLSADVKEVGYADTKLRDFNGVIALSEGKLQLDQTTFKLAGANMSMQGSYRPVQPNSALFDAAFKADSFDVAKAYKEVPLFREMASAAEYATGLVSVDYKLAGRLNAQMAPLYPSIKGGGTLKLEDVQFKGYKLFSAVSKATGKDSINNPRLKAVVFKSSVANNIITIERTKMKVLGFRPRIEGQVSLGGKLNLRFRLGLPPFGVVGIPMTVIGTSDKPIVKMRKGKEQDALSEEEDIEEAEQ
jgi:AsmA protein